MSRGSHGRGGRGPVFRCPRPDRRCRSGKLDQRVVVAVSGGRAGVLVAVGGGGGVGAAGGEEDRLLGVGGGGRAQEGLGAAEVLHSHGGLLAAVGDLRPAGQQVGAAGRKAGGGLIDAAVGGSGLQGEGA